jgi:hypothetical protein
MEFGYDGDWWCERVWVDAMDEMANLLGFYGLFSYLFVLLINLSLLLYD